MQLAVRWFLGLSFVALLAACATPSTMPAPQDRAAEVRAAESAFAKSMADRDFAAFAALVAEDAVFVNGGNPLRGKPAILAFWKRFFDEPTAPFSWKPEVAEVSALGGLGYTEGPVSSPTGQTFARFHSTWRRTTAGNWQVVFDNGQKVCN